MTSILQIANGIGMANAKMMKGIGIDSIEKLASSSVEDLLKIESIGAVKAKLYIEIAKKHLKSLRTKERIENLINKNKPQTSKLESKACDLLLFGEDRPKVSIDSIKQLASSKVEDISRIKGIEISNAKRYIDIAQKYLESMRIEPNGLSLGKIELTSPDQKPKLTIDNSEMVSKLEKISITQKLKKKEFKPKLEIKIPPKEPVIEKSKTPPAPPVLKSFFNLETMQRIRYLHFMIKKLEESLEKNQDFSTSELNHIIDYIKLLNINYKTQSQIKILKELEITSSFYDPLAKREIAIWDLIFECSRVLWVSAKAYSYLSRKYEAENLMENAIVSMVECSKMYKTAAYFSAACTRQEDKGYVLSVENLELNSEECRILAQSLATSSEEDKRNYSMAANLSAGLSALTKRLAFFKQYNISKESQLKAQYLYDIGRSCHLKAKSLIRLSIDNENDEKIEKLQKKAIYYYHKAESIWENMIETIETLSFEEKENLKINLSIVNDCIIECDVELIDDDEALNIQDPEPLIIVPENLAPFIPRTTNFLTKFKQTELNFDAYLRYKNLMSDVLVNFNKIEELKNSKAGIGRTLKQLKILYENNDIDINSFTELFEKYSIKLESIENAIQNLKNPNGNIQVNKKTNKPQLVKSAIR